LRIVGGRWRGRPLASASGRAQRPTLERVREALFSHLGGRVADAVVVDLFAGSGAFAFEALSRDARGAVLVERAPEALRAMRANAAGLGAGARVRIVAGDVFAFLEGRFGPVAEVDIAFADPPYGTAEPELLGRIAGAPALSWSAGALIVLETAARDPQPAAVAGWRRRPERTYGDARIVIAEREPEHESTSP